VVTRLTWVLVAVVAGLLVLVATSQNGTPPPPQCLNGLNDDPTEDARIDYPSDPGCSSATDDSELGNPVPGPIAGRGYHLVFEDDFTGTSFDPTKWSRPWFDRSNFGGPENYTVSNGLLHLTSRRSEGYKKAELTTVDLSGDGTPMRSWTYGYFEARSKWAVGHGNWSGFWLNNLEHQIYYQRSEWPCWRTPPLLWSEIDIYETNWQHPETQWTTVHRNVNRRCNIQDERRPGDGHRWMVCEDDDGSLCNLTADFHVYGMLWTPDRVKWYRDGELICSERYNDTPKNCADVATFDSTNQPMYLNLWLHPCDWAETPICPDASTPDVMDHQFDWVRVWQKENGVPR
jgi:beta-glucanase (GH16 family)